MKGACSAVMVATTVMLSAGGASSAGRGGNLDAARVALGSMEALQRAIDLRASDLRETQANRSRRVADCDGAIRQAAAAFGVPVVLALAIGQVESGGRPWAVNSALTSRQFASMDEAKAYVADERRQGVGTIDVGCMQISLYWHPEAFATLDEAFDPARNAAAGMQRVADLWRSTGSWTQAVARYHGGSEQEQDLYACRVLAAYRSLMGRTNESCGAPPSAVSGALPLVSLVPNEATETRNREVQKRLAELGIAVGKPDGVIGPATATGIQAFQASRGLPRTGRLNDATLAALGLDGLGALQLANREDAR